MQTTNKMERLSIYDLKDLEAFKTWLRRCLDVYGDEKIPNSHLLIYLHHMKTMVMNQDNIDKSHWLNLIKDIESKVKTFERVSDKNEL